MSRKVKAFIITVLLFNVLPVHAVDTGIIETDGHSQRYVYNEKLSDKARNKIALGFFLRRDLWIKNRSESFIKKHVSQPLTPSKAFAEKYDLVERPVRNDAMVTVTQKQRKNNRHIVMFHGGGYIFAKTGLEKHEKGLSVIMNYLGDRVTFVDYPGLQTADYREISAVSKDAYRQLISLYPNDEFIFFGNSAGGNLALLVAQDAKIKGAKLPSKYILLSPSASVSLDEMKKYDFCDTILSLSFIKYAADLFRADKPYNSPQVSSLYGDFQGLGDIAIFNGTSDMLYPDSLKLYEKAKSSGVKTHHYQYNKMWHDWMLYTDYDEAHLAWKQAAEFIK